MIWARKSNLSAFIRHVARQDEKLTFRVHQESPMRILLESIIERGQLLLISEIDGMEEMKTAARQPGDRSEHTSRELECYLRVDR